MEIDKKAVGRRIKHIRTMLNFTMDQFGEKMGGATRSLVSKWENGTYTPNSDRLSLLSDLSGISEEDILHGAEPYTLPDYIQSQLDSEYFNTCANISSFEDFKSIVQELPNFVSLSENQLKDEFEYLKHLQTIKRNKENTDHLYQLEQLNQVKTESKSLVEENDSLKKIIIELTDEMDLKQILSNANTLRYGERLITKNEKELIIDVIESALKYSDSLS